MGCPEEREEFFQFLELLIHLHEKRIVRDFTLYIMGGLQVQHYGFFTEGEGGCVVTCEV